MFYAQFVNIKGQPNASTPADLWMESMVRVTKKHIKSMVSNKNEANIFRRTSALAGLDAICTNFDEQSGVPVRKQW